MSNNNEREKTPKLYKNRYMLSFYDLDGEEFRYCFNNVKEILKFKGKPITENNVKKMNIIIYNVLKKGKDNNICRFLTGEKLRLYLVDMQED